MRKKSLLRLKHFVLVCILSGYIYNVSGQSVSAFENLILPADSMWYGADLNGGFTSGAAYFVNIFTDWGGGYTSWDGFAYSNKIDTVTPGYDNQYSAYAGSGYNNSPNFAIGYCYPTTKIKIINNTHPKIIHGVYVTNNTYAALSMHYGDAYSKKFGGTSGNDQDWFKLSIWGYQNGQHSDTVDFYLADFRFVNNDSDYIVKDWQWINLTNLGNADSLEFSLSSSDNGVYGMNTPAYFCIDDFLVDFLPENETGNDSLFLDQCLNFTFNLDTFFVDIDTHDSLLTYEIIYNSIPWIFVPTITDNLLNVYVSCPDKGINTIYKDTLVIRAHSFYGYADLVYHFSSDITGNININNLDRITISPNPTTDFLEITTQGETITFILNTSGKTVWSGNINNGEKINVSQLSPGMYFISHKNQFYKFIKN